MWLPAFLILLILGAVGSAVAVTVIAGMREK